MQHSPIEMSQLNIMLNAVLAITGTVRSTSREKPGSRTTN